ncbi:putative HECT-type ubiquitin ligase-interacting protein creD [Diplodia seriata]|uniref:Putative HECT-type ubiquitin ligase-interacting protein creD n=1 Tax=Diplodia seriata TaxID=420778 RepID=A0A1S8BCG0_9PEZI|nr:putative HECT-type ubiquitin ligase-interacting protein creD [Diplodia seriata]
MAVYFLLTPLKHGTRIGPIHLDLVQTEVLTATRDGRPWRRDRTVTTIASTVASVPPDCKGELAVDRRSSLGDSDMRDESFSFAVKLPIDPAGYRRVQSVDDEKIKIRYTLKVCVDLLNPEGHLSKVGSHSYCFPYPASSIR